MTGDQCKKVEERDEGATNIPCQGEIGKDSELGQAIATRLETQGQGVNGDSTCGSETKRIHRDPKAIESLTKCPGGRETRDEGTRTRAIATSRFGEPVIGADVIDHLSEN